MSATDPVPSDPADPESFRDGFVGRDKAKRRPEAKEWIQKSSWWWWVLPVVVWLGLLFVSGWLDVQLVELVLTGVLAVAAVGAVVASWLALWHAAALTPPGPPLASRSVAWGTLVWFARWIFASVLVVVSAMAGADMARPDVDPSDVSNMYLLVALILGYFGTSLALGVRLILAGVAGRNEAWARKWAKSESVERYPHRLIVQFWLLLVRAICRPKAALATLALAPLVILFWVLDVVSSLAWGLAPMTGVSP